MKKNWKRAGIMVLSLLMVAMSLPLGSLMVHAEEGEGEPEASGALYKDGDFIKFGHYEQDGNLENGKEEIEWEVLNVVGKQALVLSRYALDGHCYRDIQFDDDSVTWETCNLRRWLNNEFINEAFTMEEQAKISLGTLENDDNPYYGTEGGNDTQDKIFCLSLTEVKLYIGYTLYEENNMGGYSQKAVVEPTPYATSHSAGTTVITEQHYDTYLKEKGYTRDIIGRQVCGWWLRTSGMTDTAKCEVSPNGRVGARVSFSDFTNNGVRPAMWIDLSEIPQPGIFSDIKYGTWQYNAAKAVYDKGYMTGTGTKDGKIVFSPNTDMTRTQFVQALYSMDGKPEVTYEQKFSDVKESAWYAKAVTWASNNGVVAGNADGTFGINGKATREQLALMFYKYAVSKNLDVTVQPSTTLEGFADANKVDSWALTAVKWAVERGIISGKGNATAGYRIDPTGKATRVECAAMMNKFDEIYSKSLKTEDEDLEEPIALPMEEVEEVPVPEEEAEDIIEDEDTAPEDREEEDTVDDEDAVPEDVSEDNTDREDIIPK